MESERTRDGVHMKRCAAAILVDTLHDSVEQYCSGAQKHALLVCSATQPNKYTQEQLQLFKGQDIGYVAAKTQAEAKVPLSMEYYHLRPPCLERLYPCACAHSLSTAPPLVALHPWMFAVPLSSVLSLASMQ